MSVGIIIQARMGSSRLPGKVLKLIARKPLLEHVVGRLEMLAYDCPVIVATSTLAQDDVIEQFCVGRVKCFRGSESDVLDRYYRCALEAGFQHIVRLTADNPFTDMEELARLIDLHLAGTFDYTHSFGSLPIGVGAEIFTFDALRESIEKGLAPNHREHVNEYIQENPDLYRIGELVVPIEKQAPALRLTVDTQEDYERACGLAALTAPNWQTTQGAISAC